MALRSVVVRAPEDASDAALLRLAPAPSRAHVVRRRSRGVVVATVSWIEGEVSSGSAAIERAAIERAAIERAASDGAPIDCAPMECAAIDRAPMECAAIEPTIGAEEAGYGI